MPALIVARAVQGLGAGAVQPMSMTIVGDLYSVEERARVQGYLASVWAISAVVGPTLGGVFAEYLSWRWIFFVNLPLGAVAGVDAGARFREKVERRAHRVDYLGAALLTGGCSLLILGLLEGGVRVGVGLGAERGDLRRRCACCWWRSSLVERRAAEPVLPLWVVQPARPGRRQPGLAGGRRAADRAELVPADVRAGRARRRPAGGRVRAGRPDHRLADRGEPQSGRIYLRIGFRDTALIGVGDRHRRGGAAPRCSPPARRSGRRPARRSSWASASGLTTSPTIVAAQSVVGWERRGVVTAANMFARSLGSAVGAAIFGAIANATLAARFADPPAGARRTGPEGPRPPTA